APVGWSPDGKMIAVGYGSQVGGDHSVLGILSIADKKLKLISSARWLGTGSIVWFSDGSGLVLQAQEQDPGRWQLWRVSYPGGQARPITNDLSSYEGNLTLTADGNMLLAVQHEQTSHIWIAPVEDTSRARMIPSGKTVQDGLGGLTWAP